MRAAVPMWDEQIEADVIAACLVDPDAVTRVDAVGITPGDFFVTRARYAYEAIQAVSAASGAESVHTHSVAYELRQRQADDGQVSMLHVVTLQWLSRIVEELPTSIGAEWYAGRVREMAQRRRLQAAAGAIEAMAAAGDVDGAGKAAALLDGATAGTPATPRPAYRAQPSDTLVGVPRVRTAVMVQDDAFECWCGASAVAYDAGERPVCAQHGGVGVFE